MSGSIRVRIRERDLYIPALRAAEAEGGFIATSKLIDVLTNEFEPEGEDATILDGRNDSRFSQIVRNLVSHRESSTSIFFKGLAEYTGDGIKITQRGRQFLSQVPE
ncbi:hypothetical protein [Microvirga mediterraneensis]|uniref:Uncharacterized protein n=1 Tax=Microvirga mediterraneensis TaxID=2754695 RepID=A0A838BHX1_9HYPH|nr:hypothetical protein [Microvirga mediterraneensis]MBA1155138.1 hypothetical protein [Microvirga mediterraneensis]